VRATKAFLEKAAFFWKKGPKKTRPFFEKKSFFGKSLAKNSKLLKNMMSLVILATSSFFGVFFPKKDRSFLKKASNRNGKARKKKYS